MAETEEYTSSGTEGFMPAPVVTNNGASDPQATIQAQQQQLNSYTAEFGHGLRGFVNNIVSGFSAMGELGTYVMPGGMMYRASRQYMETGSFDGYMNWNSSHVYNADPAIGTARWVANGLDRPVSTYIKEESDTTHKLEAEGNTSYTIGEWTGFATSLAASAPSAVRGIGSVISWARNLPEMAEGAGGLFRGLSGAARPAAPEVIPPAPQTSAAPRPTPSGWFTPENVVVDMVDDGTGAMAPETAVSPKPVDTANTSKPADPPATTDQGTSAKPEAASAPGTAVGFRTAQGSLYERTPGGPSSRFKLSPGRGQGSWQDVAHTLYFDDKPLDPLDMGTRPSGGFLAGADYKLGYVDQSGKFTAFKTHIEGNRVLPDPQIVPDGARPVIQLSERSSGHVLEQIPAELTPRPGLTPFDVGYGLKADGTVGNWRHFGNQITEVFTDSNKMKAAIEAAGVEPKVPGTPAGGAPEPTPANPQAAGAPKPADPPASQVPDRAPPADASTKPSDPNLPAKPSRELVPAEAEERAPTTPKEDAAAPKSKTAELPFGMVPGGLRVRSRITFPIDGYTLTPEHKAVLDQIAADWKQKGGIIDLAGHASTTGPEPHNQVLSQERVDEAKKYLVSKGIDAKKIKTEADGSTKDLPVASGPKQEIEDNRSVTYSFENDKTASGSTPDTKTPADKEASAGAKPNTKTPTGTKPDRSAQFPAPSYT